MNPNLPPGTGRGRVLAFAGFRRSVADLGRAIDFYVGALGFTCESVDAAGPGAPRCAHLQLGAEFIDLCEWPGGQQHSAGELPDGIASAGFQHLAIVTADFGAALARLRRFSPVAISTGDAVRLPASAGGVTAYKFRDPDGHPLELISFPAGTGDPKWQRSYSDELTLGIDHSAIGVGNVEKSVTFYVDGLGLALSSRQVNSGSEQDQLDGAPDVVVDVVSLTPAGVGTPHLELLGYRQPAPRPWADSAAITDDRSDRLTWRVEDLDAIVARLASAAQSDGGDKAALANLGPGEWLLRDPDGHLMLLQDAAMLADEPRSMSSHQEPFPTIPISSGTLM